MGGQLDKGKAQKKAKGLRTYSEAKNLLEQLGYEEYNKGRTSGSQVIFIRKADMSKILLHKPHPGNIMDVDVGAVKDLARHLEEVGEL